MCLRGSVRTIGLGILVIAVFAAAAAARSHGSAPAAPPAPANAPAAPSADQTVYPVDQNYTPARTAPPAAVARPVDAVRPSVGAPDISRVRVHADVPSKPSAVDMDKRMSQILKQLPDKVRTNSPDIVRPSSKGVSTDRLPGHGTQVTNRDRRTEAPGVNISPSTSRDIVRPTSKEVSAAEDTHRTVEIQGRNRRTEPLGADISPSRVGVITRPPSSAKTIYSESRSSAVSRRTDSPVETANTKVVTPAPGEVSLSKERTPTGTLTPISLPGSRRSGYIYGTGSLPGTRSNSTVSPHSPLPVTPAVAFVEEATQHKRTLPRTVTPSPFAMARPTGFDRDDHFRDSHRRDFGDWRHAGFDRWRYRDFDRHRVFSNCWFCGCYPCVCSWRHWYDDCWWPWWDRRGGWSIGYHGRHWSVSIGGSWPSNTWCGYDAFCYRRPHIETEIVYQPIYYYEPVYVPSESVPVVEVYDEMDRLIDLVKYGDTGQRRDAAKELGYQDTLRALEPLIFALETDSDATVRYLAARSLGKLGYREGLPALHKAVDNDPDEVVRSEAQDSIDAILRG